MTASVQLVEFAHVEMSGGGGGTEPLAVPLLRIARWDLTAQRPPSPPFPAYVPPDGSPLAVAISADADVKGLTARFDPDSVLCIAQIAAEIVAVRSSFTPLRPPPPGVNLGPDAAVADAPAALLQPLQPAAGKKVARRFAVSGSVTVAAWQVEVDLGAQYGAEYLFAVSGAGASMPLPFRRATVSGICAKLNDRTMLSCATLELGMQLVQKGGPGITPCCLSPHPLLDPNLEVSAFDVGLVPGCLWYFLWYDLSGRTALLLLCLG